ncbi:MULTISPECIES: DUF2599 domain-containing protein [Cellulomonas]|uniref:DUF2599 domain-containing protein n=1 Tax=Cellulomonas iranensis TaxID=76862 RepID=A0ABU0GKS5_9CELL|nr:MULTISPECIES: DUF2599 domain-containing protein [Cellulomonas]MDQ0425960.1 hypothetical protein [Cellulomonas iranensis]
MTRARARTVTTAVVVLLLAACAPTSLPGPAAGTPTPGPAAPATGSATDGDALLDADVVRQRGLPLGDAGRGHLLPVPHDATVDVVPGEDGAAAYAVAAGGDPAAWVAAPAGGGVALETDGSAVLRGAGGDVLVALGRPAGEGRTASWQVEGDVLALRVGTPTDGAAGAGGAVSFEVGTAALTSATWGEAEGGRSLAVVPAPWVRGGSLAAQRALESQLEATEPEAATPTMRAQLWCHVLGAPDKASWNLEPWRPEVGTGTLIATRCNPTDADA